MNACVHPSCRSSAPPQEPGVFGTLPGTVDFDGDLLVGEAMRDRQQHDGCVACLALSPHGDISMSLGTILLIILIIALLGGFTGFGGGYGYGFGHKSMGVLGTVIIIILILILLGRI
jgi:hypothetical protein